MPKTGLTHGAIMEGSEIQQPVEIQGRLAQTIQTHNALSIGANAWSSSAYLDGAGFSTICVTASMASGTGMSVVIDFSHDGVNYFSGVTIYDSTGATFAPSTEIPLSARYFRVGIKNKDATNAKTTSAYAYLKA
jgi:hypothetical protein